MNYKIKCTALALMSVCCGAAFSAADLTMASDTDVHYRSSLAAGPRYINDEVMSNSGFDTAMELGLGVFRNSMKNDSYYGLEAFANNAWDSRFNSVNDASDTVTATTLVHNSSSMEALVFAGKNWGSWSTELGAGAQFSWVNWLASPQEAEDRLRVVPKVRVAVNYKMKNNAHLFIAVNQTFNHYGSMACSSDATNCVDDEGYVSVTDLKLGVSIALG